MMDPIVYQTNAVYGSEPKPNQSATRLGVPIFINDIGLRNDESHAALMRSGRRILVIGDSVTYGGSRIRQADLFTEVLERRLQAQDFSIKVLNAGVNGYSVSQRVNRARRLVKETAPDYLVVYVIRGDFFRPPLQYLTDGNYIYPTGGRGRRSPNSYFSRCITLTSAIESSGTRRVYWPTCGTDRAIMFPATTSGRSSTSTSRHRGFPPDGVGGHRSPQAARPRVLLAWDGRSADGRSATECGSYHEVGHTERAGIRSAT